MHTILLIEDDPLSREVLHELLDLSGYGVRVAETAEAALGQIEGSDLVIADVMLPGMSGLEFTRLLRETHPELPVLMLSALARHTDQSAGMGSGATLYMTKPYDVHELLRQIEKLLKRA
ncbi:response regulator transcription factor [Deinococcus misasensis]|uniref:response regulator transcription factor n=1 Tax=Deinococcus misasensis TaxID=392413 RepID=UPI00068BAC82|nr:response regulator transcription factor [Deinococcus misasensis]